MDLRTDLAAFSRRVLGRELREHQLEAARSEAFVRTIAAGGARARPCSRKRWPSLRRLVTAAAAS
jgi:hypothetical protein